MILWHCRTPVSEYPDDQCTPLQNHAWIKMLSIPSTKWTNGFQPKTGVVFCGYALGSMFRLHVKEAPFVRLGPCGSVPTCITLSHGPQFKHQHLPLQPCCRLAAWEGSGRWPKLGSLHSYGRPLLTSHSPNSGRRIHLWSELVIGTSLSRSYLSCYTTLQIKMKSQENHHLWSFNIKSKTTQMI